jgi:LemA protein
LLVTVERYPELRSTQAFSTLQTQLEGTENRIAVERQRFNDAVQLFNVSVQTFPGAIYASFFGFKPKPYFTGTPAAQTPPTVNFDFSGKTPATTQK